MVVTRDAVESFGSGPCELFENRALLGMRHGARVNVAGHVWTCTEWSAVVAQDAKAHMDRALASNLMVPAQQRRRRPRAEPSSATVLKRQAKSAVKRQARKARKATARRVKAGARSFWDWLAPGEVYR